MRIALCFMALWLVAAVAPADLSIGFSHGDQEAIVANFEHTILVFNRTLEFESSMLYGSETRNYEVGLWLPLGDKGFAVGTYYSTYENQPRTLQFGLRFKAERKGSIPVGKTFLDDLWELYLDLDDETQAEIEGLVQYIVDSLNEYAEAEDDA